MCEWLNIFGTIKKENNEENLYGADIQHFTSADSGFWWSRRRTE
jgi:hypothetical protein